MDKKAAFLGEYSGGHLYLDTARSQVLTKATTKAAIDKHGLHVV